MFVLFIYINSSIVQINRAKKLSDEPLYLRVFTCRKFTGEELTTCEIIKQRAVNNNPSSYHRQFFTEGSSDSTVQPKLRSMSPLSVSSFIFSDLAVLALIFVPFSILFNTTPTKKRKAIFKKLTALSYMEYVT